MFYNNDSRLMLQYKKAFIDPPPETKKKEKEEKKKGLIYSNIFRAQYVCLWLYPQ
jgi:hypothetical protein